MPRSMLHSPRGWESRYRKSPVTFSAFEGEVLGLVGLRGAGKVVLDIRRGDGPKECFNYTMASLAVTDGFLAQRPDDARRAVAAMKETHAALKKDVSLAAQVGRKVFPPREAALIAALIERDLPYYSTEITPQFFAAMNEFARRRGSLKGDPIFSEVVSGIR